jgi:hypothetical protein
LVGTATHRSKRSQAASTSGTARLQGAGWVGLRRVVRLMRDRAAAMQSGRGERSRSHETRPWDDAAHRRVLNWVRNTTSIPPLKEGISYLHSPLMIA